jgi:hypothetical protein
MSEPLRVALVAEGPTDIVVLRAAIGALLENREFEVTALQPELSIALKPRTGGGWAAVYLWCRQMVKQTGGPPHDNALFSAHDLLVLHVDADVAEKRYTDDPRIQDPPNDLPCDGPCPPPSATTDALRRVVLGWLDATDVPVRTVLCTPSKSTETWVLAALFPDDGAAPAADLECRADAAAVLQSKPLDQRLIRSGHKQIKAYRERENELRSAWPEVRTKCSEAERFSREFVGAWTAVFLAR